MTCRDYPHFGSHTSHHLTPLPKWGVKAYAVEVIGVYLNLAAAESAGCFITLDAYIAQELAATHAEVFGVVLFKTYMYADLAKSLNVGLAICSFGIGQCAVEVE